MDAPTLNTIGLLLDIAGVVLLFRYGLPNEVALGGVLTWRADSYEKEHRRVRARARLGLALLIAGFVLQAVSNHV